MRMKRKLSVAFLLVVASALAAGYGCAKKKPIEPTPPPAPEAPAPPAPPPPAPPPPAPPKPEPPPAADPFAGDLEAVNRYVAEQGLLGAVYFDFDRYDVKPEARERLQRNAEFLGQHPEFLVRIEGHCDERGTNEYNLALGQRRADAARDYLVTLGVERARLETVTYGEEAPVCTEHAEPCWSRNRRAQFVITSRR